VSTNKKLQVFVSSTFEDLRDQRQAAVEAILKSGHIPAGMELFAAGDESQMVVIRRWINASDVFLLILGRRYGSIEPTTGKSYVELEYEYAVERQKPLFATVMASKLLEITSPDAAAPYAAFRALVEQKMVKYWCEAKDIELAIHETLSEFTQRPEIRGWVRAEDTTNMGAISEEIARLSRENAHLRERLAAAESLRLLNSVTFEELFALLATTKREFQPTNTPEMNQLQSIAKFFGHEKPAPVDLFWHLSSKLQRGTHMSTSLQMAFALQLEEAGLISPPYPSQADTLYRITAIGTQFLLRLRNAYDMSVVEEFRA
jgi:hypothetical protein